jgi:hypothetical protein
MPWYSEGIVTQFSLLFIYHRMQTIMKHEGVKGSLQADSDHVDVEDRFDVLVDANDQLLERVVSNFP